MRLSLRSKILGSLLIVSGLLIGTTTISLYSSQKVSDVYNQYPTDVVPALQKLGEFRMNVMSILYRTMQMTLPGNHPEELERLRKKIADGVKDANKQWEEIAQTVEPNEKEDFEKTQKSFLTLMGHVENSMKLLENVTPENVAKVADLYRGQTAKDRHQFYADLDVIVKIHNESLNQLNKSALEIQSTAKAEILAATVVGFLLALILGLLISNKVNSSITHMIENLGQGSSQVKHAVDQLNQAGLQLASHSTESAASIEEIVASLEELTSMVKINSDNAQQAATLSQASNSAVEDSDVRMKNLIQSMDELTASSRKIEEIIHVIDDIAFQTNLLALNAAVEAARAGEQGKGFAVVADAVRALAQRSADAAKDIANLIKESVERTERGSRSVHQSGEALTQILINVKKVADLNNEIAAASKEQSGGLTQIASAMNNLDKSAQTNAATAEEISASTTEVTSQITSINRDVLHLEEFIFARKAESKLMTEAFIKVDEASHKHETANSHPMSSHHRPSPSLSTPDQKPSTNISKLEPAREAASARKKSMGAGSAEVIPFDDDHQEDSDREKLAKAEDF